MMTYYFLVGAWVWLAGFNYAVGIVEKRANTFPRQEISPGAYINLFIYWPSHLLRRAINILKAKFNGRE